MSKSRPKMRWVWPVIILFLAINIPGLKNIWVLHQQIKDLRQQETRLQQQKRSLQTEVAKLKTDQEVERIAREQLGLIKPGEHLLVPVDKNGQ